MSLKQKHGNMGLRITRVEYIIEERLFIDQERKFGERGSGIEDD
jgi:hypothetical protein